jgi:cell division septation protein DedD
MDDQGSWKGHSFTLIIFIGIVILCSIFFVLGIVVGRGQVQHSAESASANPSVKNTAGDSHGAPQIEKIDSSASAASAVKDTVIVVDPAPETPKADPPPAKSAAKTKVAAEPPPAPATDRPAPRPSGDKMIYLQVGAFEQPAAANKEVDDLRKKGFHALIENSDGPKKLYRVQVGPFSNNADVDIARRKLEALGYKQPMKK